jgi:hypothetical protein
MARRPRIVAAVLAGFLAAFVLPPAARAAFPGANGKIAISRAGDIYTINPDGSGAAQLTSGPDGDSEPAWSADGGSIAFSRSSGSNVDVYSMRADGSALTRLTTDPGSDHSPSWSPDGRTIYFAHTDATEIDVYKVNADATGLTDVTNTPASSEDDPAVSPDGARIAFSSTPNIFVMDADGSNRTPVTGYPPPSRDSFREADDPDWSPGGGRIAYALIFGGGSFFYRSVHVVNSDGTGDTELPPASAYEEEGPAFSPDGSWVLAADNDGIYLKPADGSAPGTKIPNTTANDRSPGWQPLSSGYPRPKAATPVRVSLVPAFAACTQPNRTHGPPLAFSSCSPPTQASGHLTLGTVDSNGEPTKSSGFVRYGVQAGDPSTPADEADVRITASITDVRSKSDLSDYAGELQLDEGLRITDRDNGSPGPGTVSDTDFPVTMPCAPTSDATVGSACQVDTTAEAIVPNAVKEGARAVWEIGQVKVYDGGTDGAAQTTADNTLFMDEGVFVP